MTTFRSFDTVLSYNNSAVGIYWPKVTLEQDQEHTQIFYISLATGDTVPGGAAYISGQSIAQEEEPEEESPAPAVQNTKPAEETSVQNIQAVKEEDVEATPKKIEPAVSETPATETVSSAPQNVAAVKENTQENKSGITNEKLSFDYIQKLLDKIENLQEGDPEVNKAEINALNAELDAILTILNAN